MAEAGGAVARATLQTIADRVGVSRMTVSNAFSRPDQLSESLRERILAAAEEVGYVGPDPAARALARGTTGAVGILLTESPRDAFADEVATGFLGAIADELAPTGLALTLLHSSGQGEVNPARDIAMDGALVYSCDPNTAAVGWLERRGLPLVFVDQAPGTGIVSVNVDDRHGARAAAQHVVDLGHRRVGILAPGIAGASGVATDAVTDATNHVTRQRLLGWLEALGAAGIEPVVMGQRRTDLDEAYQLAVRMLEPSDRPTAVLAFSDMLAHAVLRAAASRGLRIPDDLSVVGFDDSPLARRLQPALTTVRQDVAAKGKAAAAELTRAMERARAGGKVRARSLLLPTELVVRDSTAAAPLRPSDAGGENDAS